MDQDKKDALIAEYHKERELCSGANASEYHKKRFAQISKELGINAKADKPKKETVAETTSTTETEETTVVSTTESTN